MLIKASEIDKDLLLDYCKSESIFNIFIIGDIENFGFSSFYQDVWYEMNDKRIKGIALRYHKNLIVYSQLLDMDFSLINSLLEEYHIDIISGKNDVIDKVTPYLKKDYTRNDLVFCKHSDMDSLSRVLENIVIAEESQAMDIALAYGEIKEFENLYSDDVNERYTQISTRIRSGEGKHMMILDDKGIVCHGNTTGENSLSGMVGGIFTRNDLRNKGYASAITSALVRDLNSRNKEVGLFYKGQSEGRLFTSLGFEKIGIWSTLRREKDE